MNTGDVRELFVFFTQRPMDDRPWPLVYESRTLAEAAPHRCSEVVEVRVALSTTAHQAACEAPA